MGEFRRELNQLSSLFSHFDVEGVGFLKKTEAWAALNTLGLTPKLHREKTAVMDLITNNCSALSSDPLAMALAAMRGSASKVEPGNMTFEGFLSLISQVRSWQLQSMREHLRPLFDRCTRTRNGSDAVLGIPEISRALDELVMSPTKPEEQQTLHKLLEDANEWGFQPLAPDFEAFVRFIRHARELRSTQVNSQERQYAADVLGFEERIVNEYRVAFDMLDRKGVGGLSISGVRQIFTLLSLRQISSDRLRDLFSRSDVN